MRTSVFSFQGHLINSLEFFDKGWSRNILNAKDLGCVKYYNPSFTVKIYERDDFLSKIVHDN